MSEFVWVLVDDQKPVMTVTEAEFAQEWVEEAQATRVATTVPLYRGHPPGLTQKALERARQARTESHDDLR